MVCLHCYIREAISLVQGYTHGDFQMQVAKGCQVLVLVYGSIYQDDIMK